jgi:hypothetical protein
MVPCTGPLLAPQRLLSFTIVFLRAVAHNIQLHSIIPSRGLGPSCKPTDGSPPAYLHREAEVESIALRTPASEISSVQSTLWRVISLDQGQEIDRR